MGSRLGVYDDDEVADLTDDDKKELRAAVIELLRDEGVLAKFLKDNPEIRKQLRDQTGSKAKLETKIKPKPL